MEVEYVEALAEILAKNGRLRALEESRRQEGAGGGKGWGWEGEQLREAGEQVWSNAPVNAPPMQGRQG